MDCGRRDRPHRIQQLAAGQEHDAATAQGQQIAAGPRELLHVMQPALHRADCDCVNDEKRLEPGLDGEEAGKAFGHGPG
jgi:hypothetical protein